MHSKRNSAATLFALAFLMAGAGCSVSPGYSSVLTDGGTDEMCFVEVPPSEGKTLVGEVITNTGDRPVAVTEVRLLDAKDLVVEDAFMIPMQSGSGTALGSGSTLTKDPEVQALLDQAEPAEGYIIAPGEQVNVVTAVSIAADVRQGTASGFEVRSEEWPTNDISDARIRMTMTRDSCF